jgi:hypothetical protein
MRMRARGERALVILLLDPEGQESAIALAARRLGHRVVTATGTETALVVLGSLVPDVVVVRAVAAERDREAAARLSSAAPEVAVRIVDAPAALAGALAATPHLLN